MKCLALLAFILLAASPAASAQTPPQAAPQPLSVTPDRIGPPGSGAMAELHLPPGPGPFPAVVLLHGCSGITPNMARWAARLVEWGQAALVLDSFGPRGVENVCHQAARVPPALRAADALAAAAALRARLEIDPGRIALIGFSHGGSSALAAASRGIVHRAGATPFTAVVAFYPWCPGAAVPLASPVLTLIGDADDWTPASRCEALRAAWRPAFGRWSLQLYPGATHAFDAPGRERLYFGHRLRHDPAATADAAARLRRFIESPAQPPGGG
ncbi:Dienelactone hydrolase [Roseomonas rosea]|uniref:Dienelactone hydrolase n=1 Tax=Muricoccus roseus TaxID=198092 RepID=A0A1M6FFN8_9PROT|nr:dienelactone hydrolase family protein [Roseomonas rosea]SHI96422.1 Dienelactone hydrolase [Roseomonas rosea]